MTTPLQLPTLQSTRGRTGSSTSTTSGKTLRPAKYAPTPSTAAPNSTILMMYSLILMYRGILPDPDVSVVGAGSNRRDAAGNGGNV